MIFRKNNVPKVRNSSGNSLVHSSTSKYLHEEKCTNSKANSCTLGILCSMYEFRVSKFTWQRPATYTIKLGHHNLGHRTEVQRPTTHIS